MMRLSHILLGLGLSIFIASPAYSDEEKLYDQDAKIIKRIPPIMPPTTKASGYCCMVFDVSKTGQPINVNTTYCTASLLAQASKESVSKWTYEPAKVNGETVTKRGLDTFITFHLADQNGRLIPSSTGYLEPKIDIANIPPSPKIKGPGGYKKFSEWQQKYLNTSKPCGDLIS